MALKAFKIKEILKEIFISVFKPLKGILTLLALLVFTAASSLLVVTPLWYFATYYRQAYTVFALCLLGLGTVLFVILRVKKIMTEVKQAGEQAPNGITRLIHSLLALFSLGLFLWFFWRRDFLLTLLVPALYFIGLGVLKYVDKRAKQQYNLE